MEQVIVKKKPFELVKSIDETTFVGKYNDKLYLVYSLVPKTPEFKNFLYRLKRICASGVNTFKVKIVDKKGGFIAREYIDGPFAYQVLADHDFDQKIYKSVFTQAFIGKTSKLSFDFNPDKWILAGDSLYYIGTTFEQYNEKTDFANTYIRLWFFTKEFISFAKDKGLEVDRSRLKPDYELNRQIVLTACELYR